MGRSSLSGKPDAADQVARFEPCGSFADLAERVGRTEDRGHLTGLHQADDVDQVLLGAAAAADDLLLGGEQTLGGDLEDLVEIADHQELAARPQHREALPDAIACMHHSLIDQGRVGLGTRLLILGVGGLGIHGVQIARSAGAQVMATSRQPQRLALAEQYGAVGVNTAGQSLAAAVAEFTHGEGVDVVVDNIGTRASVREGIALLRPGGKFLVVAYLDESFEIPSIPLFKTELEIIGCRGSTKQDLIDVVGLVQSGQVTPVLGASYPLAQLGETAARLESGDLIGRIWLSRE